MAAIDGTTGAISASPSCRAIWPRTVHAALIESLTERQVEVSVLDIDFSRVKSGDETRCSRWRSRPPIGSCCSSAWSATAQPIEGADGKVNGWTWVEEKLSPSPLLANAATALARLALPKLGQAAIQSRELQAQHGDLPTSRGVPPALRPAGTRVAGAPRGGGRDGLDGLPATPGRSRAPAEVRLVMGRLRQTFLAGSAARRRVQARLATVAAAAIRPRRACARSPPHADARDRYLNFYGPPGTIRTSPTASWCSRA